MEKIAFVSRKHGRKSGFGTVRMIGGLCFAIFPRRAERRVYFGIPGAHDNFLQVSDAKWDGKDNSLAATIAAGCSLIEKSDPVTWVDDYSAKALEEVRAKTETACREYILELLAEHKAFKGKDWK